MKVKGSPPLGIGCTWKGSDSGEPTGTDGDTDDGGEDELPDSDEPEEDDETEDNGADAAVDRERKETDDEEGDDCTVPVGLGRWAGSMNIFFIDSGEALVPSNQVTRTLLESRS
jgi:hypothetical protein